MKLSDLKPNPNNPRVIKDERFKKLVKSIKEFPKMMRLRPIVVDDDNMILGGNMRLRALQELNYTEIPDEWVARASDLTEEERKRFIIVDNVGFGENDLDMLANEWELEDLDNWGMDISGIKVDTDVEEDEVPEVQEEAVAKLGEIYKLGEHRLMCGDSTNIEDVEKLMDGQKADMVFTDPPYNVDYQGGMHADGTQSKRERIKNDKMSSEDFYVFLLDAFMRLSENSKSGSSIYICHSDSEGLNFRKAMVDAGWLMKQCIIWAKQSMVLGRQDYQWQHEPILYGWKDGGAHYFTSDRTQTTLWSIDRPSKSPEHPTMKPIMLMSKAITNSSKSDDIILDTFGGSGSTLIACEQLNRKCYMMELDPKYVDVIIKRWENLTGEKAVKL